MPSYKTLRALTILVSVFLTAGGMFLIHAHAASPSDPGSEELIRIGLSADTATDPHAAEKYEEAIRLLFDQQNYEELERIAASARTNKERFSGGGRKIAVFYAAFSSPKSGPSATEAEWSDHFSHLEQWKHVGSNPLTPTLAMAQSYIAYAWVARGPGYSDSVSSLGWELFTQRLAQARKLLDEVAGQRDSDPAWYHNRLDLARLDDTSPDQERALFESAIALDPTYRPFYRLHAFYLQPKWSGQPGDVSRFADEMYNRLGPVEGPIEYFTIAAAIACGCKEAKQNTFSLRRMKEGYAALVQNYGPDLEETNRLAFLEWQENDPVGLAGTLQRIGSNFVPIAWQGRRENFDAAQRWLACRWFSGEPFDALDEEMKTPEGQNYAKLIQSSFDAKYSKLLQQCRKDAGDDLRGFYFYFKQDGTGRMINGFGYPVTAMGACFARGAGLRDNPMLIIPPHPDYWNKIVVDDH